MDDEMNFFEDTDLDDLLSMLAEENEGAFEEDEEMSASQRRYEEIIVKHRGEGKGNQ